MKFLVFLALCFGMSQAVEMKTKMSPKGNAIPAPQKAAELYYPQANQQSQADFMPVHVMQKPLFLQQHQQQQPQTAMLIIAQPAYVPQNVIYGNQAGMQQQLLNYFHGNPQAKYQLLFGGYQPQPSPQTYIHQHPLPQSTVPAYQIVPNPVFNGFNHLVGAPSQVNFNQVQQPYQQQQQQQIAPQYVQPMQLNQLAHLAQMAAQQYSTPSHFGGPIRSVPPIITGFENFTPEQQAQIKAQLGAHLGAPLTTATTAPATTSQYTSPVSTQATQSLNSHDFMQNHDKHASPQGSATSFTPSLLYRAQYTKG